MTSAIVGLGANLGDREQMISAAIDKLDRAHPIERVSELYETEPVGPPQPMFLNAAVRVGSVGDPELLLDLLLAIEAELGRVRREKWGPRTIDLDVLWLGSGAFASDRLVVPHPRLEERAFALAPLLDVLDPRHPDHDRYAALLARLGSPPKRRWLNRRSGASPR